MSECLFCKIIANEIPSFTVWSDEEHIAFLDINPINAGHVLVIPKDHQDYIFDLDDSAYQKLMIASKRVAEILRSKLTCKRVGLVVEGFAVSHAHVHLVPVNIGNELNPSNAQLAQKEDLEEMYNLLKKT